MVKALAGEKDMPSGKVVARAAERVRADEPHAMARMHTEGTLPHQGIRDESQMAVADLRKMEDLGLGYRLTGEPAYLAEASRLMDAWATVYKVSGNPIDETAFSRMAIALDVTRGALDPAVEKHVVTLFRAFAVNYLDWLDHHFREDDANWSSHRVKLAVLGAYESGDAGLRARAKIAYTRQVRQNIRKDGSVQDFYKRDALHYVVYDLEPLCVAALAAKAHGEDWFSTAVVGSPSVEMGARWLQPFALGEQTHEEFVHSSVRFDAARNQVGEKGYSGMWDAGTSEELYAMAGWLNAEFQPVAEHIAAGTGKALPAWIVLGEGAQ